MNYGERLRKALEMRRVSQSDLARRIGLKPQSIQYLCSDKATGSRFTSAIASELGIRSSWLASEDGPMLPRQGDEGTPVIPWESAEDLPSDDFACIPRMDIRSPGGPGSWVEEDAESYMEQGQAFRRAWLKKRGLKPENLRCVYCPGDSMEPLIQDGAQMLVDLSRTEIEDGKPYVLRYDQELRTKILYSRPGGGLTMDSVNPAYKAIDLSPNEAQFVEIVGRVVWSGSEH